MGEIRIVSSCKTCGYPYPACKKMSDIVKVYGYISMFFTTFTKGNNFCDFQFASLDIVAFPK